jgi:limonene-1,2-epoxide hydrolase
MAKVEDSQIHQQNSELQPLTIERIQDLWSKTYNREGKPDWSHIFPYYHPDIVFQDSIQRIEGIEAFTAMCNRLTKRCEQLNMDILSIVMDSNQVFFEWKMQMVFRRFPSTPVFGCTKLTIGAENRITHQRDYFDLWGTIFNGIPGVRLIYHKFMHRYFG